MNYRAIEGTSRTTPGWRTLRRRTRFRCARPDNDPRLPTYNKPFQLFQLGPNRCATHTLVQTLKNMTRHINPVFDVLKPANTPEAAMDSGARYPPPLCHPGSRKTINKKLEKWLFDTHRRFSMIWLYGPAGVGKSAVAQTFAEFSSACGLLGAAFFFSRLGNRSKPLRVVPTLAYQLAIHNNDYKHILTRQLAVDPSILDASLRVQFQRLIVEPFSLLSSYNLRKPTGHVIILDGLDECNDEDAQCELIELINDAAQRNDLPLIWLVCSRPEPHIKYTFSQPDYTILCGREELIIDDETRKDVEQYLRDSFKKIHASYRDVITTKQGRPWPPEEIFDVISKAVSGLFIFASTVIKVIGGRNIADPDAQLVYLLNMLRGLDNVGVNNPLEALDIFYTRIISQVPEHVLPTTLQILGLRAHRYSIVNLEFTAERLWTFLRLERGVFYAALHKLHSLVDVPPSEHAQERRLTFYHKSFPDYLTSRRRAGKFFVSREGAQGTYARNCLYWYSQILIYIHPNCESPR